MHFLSALFAVAALFGAVQADDPQGVITSPLQDAHITPGQSFPFAYKTRTGDCAFSYGYTVWLLTTPPETFMTPNTTGVFVSAASFGGTTIPIH